MSDLLLVFVTTPRTFGAVDVTKQTTIRRKRHSAKTQRADTPDKGKHENIRTAFLRETEPQFQDLSA